MHRRSNIRKSLMLDSSRKRQTSRKTRLRNRFLNLFAKLSIFRNIGKLFRFSVIAGFILSGMTIFLIFAIFSSYYKLKTISAVSDSVNIPSEVVQNISNLFLGKSLFFLKKEEIRSLLQKKFPEIQTISITEKWPAELEIKIEVAPAKYNIFDEESANFSSITGDGIIISNSSTKGLPVIKIKQYNRPLAIHTNLIPEDWLRKVDLAEDILKHEIKLPARESILLMKARELHFVTTEEAVIWLDISQPISPQLQKLVFAEGKIKLYSKKFDHIDLRIPKQIFWEWK